MGKRIYSLHSKSTELVKNRDVQELVWIHMNGIVMCKICGGCKVLVILTGSWWLLYGIEWQHGNAHMRVWISTTYTSFSGVETEHVERCQSEVMREGVAHAKPFWQQASMDDTLRRRQTIRIPYWHSWKEIFDSCLMRMSFLNDGHAYTNGDGIPKG